MLDRLLNIACAFDWFTPTTAFVQDFLNGPVSDFGIPADAGWSRGDIRRLLTGYGIRVWGLMFNNAGEVLMFTVPKAQAKWTYYVLQQEGVPTLYAPAEVVSSSTRRMGRETIIKSPLERVFGFLDKLDEGRF